MRSSQLSDFKKMGNIFWSLSEILATESFLFNRDIFNINIFSRLSLLQ
jgi:hypothetical protein